VLEDFTAQIDLRFGHLVEILVPEAGLFADDQPQLVGEIDDATVMRIMHQSDEVAAHGLDHPHVLLLLAARKREALVFPGIVAANAIHHQALSV